MREASLLAVALVLLAGLALAGQAETSEDDLQVDVNATYVGADTYQFSIVVDDRVELTNDSHVRVTGYFPASLGDPQKDLGGLIGILEGGTDTYCPSLRSGGVDPCFVNAAGISIKETGDVRVDAGPVTVERGSSAWGWAAATASITWERTLPLEAPVGQDRGIYQFLVSVPEAAEIAVDVELYSTQTVTVREEIGNDGGLLATSEDFQTTAGVDTAPASAAVAAEKQVPLTSEDHRLYASLAPSWRGYTATGNAAVGHNTAAVSDIAYEDPGGDRTARTSVAAGNSNGILVPGSGELGTHTFEVNAHAGLGPQDVYLVGYRGPAAS